MTEYNNPPAFPEGSWEYDGQGNVLPFQHHGMTLLDHFAGLAMQAFAPNSGRTFEQDAEHAYRLANAMLKERRKWIK